MPEIESLESGPPIVGLRFFTSGSDQATHMHLHAAPSSFYSATTTSGTMRPGSLDRARWWECGLHSNLNLIRSAEGFLSGEMATTVGMQFLVLEFVENVGVNGTRAKHCSIFLSSVTTPSYSVRLHSLERARMWAHFSLGSQRSILDARGVIHLGSDD